MMWCVDIDRADVVLLRHGETTYNAAHLLNGDPSVEVPLTDAGIAQIRALRAELAGIPWATVVVTPFGRTRQSLDELLPGRAATVDPDLGDIRLGEFESQPRATYRAWRQTHGVAEAPQGGESRRAAVERYARGLRRLAEQTPHPALVVTHDQPIRYLLNVLAGDDPVLGPAPPVPNATPYPFTRTMLAEGARRLAASLG
jgi:probable phosphoglycerate mutase